MKPADPAPSSLPPPSLDALAADLSAVATLPAEALAALLLKVAALIIAVTAPTLLATATVNEEGNDRLLTVPEAARRLNLAPSYLYELVRKGQLPALRLGRYVRLRPETLRTFIAAQETQKPLERSLYATYSSSYERRRTPTTPTATRPDPDGARTPRRRRRQLDSTSGAERDRDQRTARPAGPAVGDKRTATP